MMYKNQIKAFQSEWDPAQHYTLVPEAPLDQAAVLAASLRVGGTFVLDPCYSKELAEVIAQSLGAATRLILHPKMAISTAQVVALALGAGRTLYLPSDISLAMARAAAASLGRGALLECHPNISAEIVRVVALALARGTTLCCLEESMPSASLHPHSEAPAASAAAASSRAAIPAHARALRMKEAVAGLQAAETLHFFSQTPRVMAAPATVLRSQEASAASAAGEEDDISKPIKL